MVNDIFPTKPNDSKMTDREWENYCINVWCCNSLNAVAGFYSHMARNGDHIAERTANLLIRAQEVIRFLYDDAKRDVDETE